MDESLALRQRINVWASGNDGMADEPTKPDKTGAHDRIAHPGIGQAAKDLHGSYQAVPAAAPPALSRFIAGSMNPARRTSNFSMTSAASMLMPATTAQAVR